MKQSDTPVVEAAMTIRPFEEFVEMANSLAEANVAYQEYSVGLVLETPNVKQLLAAGYVYSCRLLADGDVLLIFEN